jgi:uncharacterized lipoprotein YajG
MVEYKGKFYTVDELTEVLNEELAMTLGANGFKVSVNDEDDNWFGQAMQTLRDKSGDQ